MATQFAFGKIVTNGLVLALDAADKNSYPGSGTTWRDLSGNGYNGTLTNGPTFNSANGGSIVFDGIDDYVECPLSWTPFSFSVYWFMNPTTRYNYNQQILTSAGWGKFVFHTTVDGSVYVGTDISSRFTPTELGANTVVLNTYQQFCFTYTYTSNTGRFYKNGNLLATKTSMGISEAWPNFQISSNGGTTAAVSGNIPLLRIYNRALSDIEVLQNYNAQKSRFNL
jgi:hypothetical protein